MKLTKTVMFAIIGVGALVVGLGVGIGAGYAIGDSGSSSSSSPSSAPSSSSVIGEIVTDFSDDAILVTDGGTINDKSFNQQAFDAIKELRGNTPDLDIYFQPSSTSASDIATQYAASDNKINGDPIILAPGFHHTSAIARYQADNPDSKTMFVVADSAPIFYPEGAAPVSLNYTLGIVFNTKGAAFYTGYLAGLYLEAMGDTTPKVGTWGGGNFAGVTDFMIGFVAGIRYYNENNGTNPDVTFSKFASDEAYTNTGFGAGGGRDNADFLVNDDVDVILPVAGPQTADALAAINASNRKDSVKVIGVDVDQSKVYGDDANKFISSVLKNVKKALIAGYIRVKSYKTAGVEYTSQTWNVGFDKGYTSYAKQFETSTSIGSTTWGDLYTKLSSVTNTGDMMVKDKKLSAADWADALAYIKEN